MLKNCNLFLLFSLKANNLVLKKIWSVKGSKCVRQCQSGQSALASWQTRINLFRPPAISHGTCPMTWTKVHQPVIVGERMLASWHGSKDPCRSPWVKQKAPATWCGPKWHGSKDPCQSPWVKQKAPATWCGPKWHGSKDPCQSPWVKQKAPAAWREPVTWVKGPLPVTMGQAKSTCCMMWAKVTWVKGPLPVTMGQTKSTCYMMWAKVTWVKGPLPVTMGQTKGTCCVTWTSDMGQRTLASHHGSSKKHLLHDVGQSDMGQRTLASHHGSNKKHLLHDMDQSAPASHCGSGCWPDDIGWRVLARSLTAINFPQLVVWHGSFVDSVKAELTEIMDLLVLFIYIKKLFFLLFCTCLHAHLIFFLILMLLLSDKFVEILSVFSMSPSLYPSIPFCVCELLLCIKNLKQNEAQSARAESTHKGVNQHLKYATQVQQQRRESPAVTLTWRACKYKVHKLHQGHIL